MWSNICQKILVEKNQGGTIYSTKICPKNGFNNNKQIKPNQTIKGKGY